MFIKKCNVDGVCVIKSSESTDIKDEDTKKILKKSVEDLKSGNKSVSNSEDDSN